MKAGCQNIVATSRIFGRSVSTNAATAIRILSIVNSPARIIGGLCVATVAIVSTFYRLFGVSLAPGFICPL